MTATAQGRWVLVVLLLAVGAAAPGCMRNERLPAGRMDDLYRLSENRWLSAEAPDLAFGDIVVPSRAVLIREPSLLASAVDLVDARDRLFSGEPVFRVLFAGELADLLAATLRDMADTTRGWAEASEDYPRRSGRDRWAADTAGVLALLYRLERGSAGVDPREAVGTEQSMSAALAPVLRSMVMLLMKRMELETGEGDLLASLGDQRSLPVEFLLHGAFRLAELQMPREAPQKVLQVFDHGPPTSVGVEHVLRERLLELRAEAENDRRPPSNKRMRAYLKAVPVLLRNMARVIEQWDKFYLVATEVGRTGDGEMVSLVADVQPGQVVRMDEVHRMAPLVTLEGRTRINIWHGDIPRRRRSARAVRKRAWRACGSAVRELGLRAGRTIHLSDRGLGPRRDGRHEDPPRAASHGDDRAAVDDGPRVHVRRGSAARHAHPHGP